MTDRIQLGNAALTRVVELQVGGLSHELFPQTPADEWRALAAGVGAALVAFLVAGLFELSFIRVWVTIVLFSLLGLLTALGRAAQRSTA